ncbi:ABC transporter ATP-binding protein [Candidatus Bathyarchaeota archaeon]|nr:ABC transporter ATP-binding protein [Candidatus Bathyarchaeota archaeon]
MTKVRVVSLTKNYGDIKALKQVNLEVEEREYLSIIGPSGCGKTTLIKLIGGIVAPSSGEIYIDEQNVTDTPIEDRNTGYVFQEIALFPHLKVNENVGYGPLVKGEDREVNRRQVREMLDLLSLEDQASFFPVELSGGAKQKTAIGRALASGSKLLLLDEPLGMLDLKIRNELRYELRKLVKDLNLTAIHVTHDQEEAMSISDRVVIMKAGEIVEVGTPRKLYIHPSKIFTAKFLGEANFLEGKVEKIEGNYYQVNVSGNKLIALGEGAVLKENEKCVLAIRPEYVKLNKKKLNEINTWSCYVINVSFIGSTILYNIITDTGKKLTTKYILTENEPDISVGDKLYATLSSEHLLIYDYPHEGLDKALDLE